jgi:hypothetical protein
MRRPWMPWLFALAAVLILGLAPVFLLLRAGWIATAVGIEVVRVAAFYAVLAYGVVKLWEFRVVRGVVYAFAVINLLVLAVTLHQAGHGGAAIALAGMCGMSVAFLAGMGLVRLLLAPGTGVTGVARTLIDEAIRMKVALIFIILLLLIVPMLPFLLDPKERLNYRLQFFLTWSVTAVSVLLSLMTVFLACATVCSEIEEKQVYLTMTKPVSRWEYLLGKWLGIVLLNAVLLSVAGGGVYTFARILSREQARDVEDYIAVHEQILTARHATDPIPPGDGGAAMYAARFAELRREFPQEYGDKPTPEQDRAIRQQAMLRWHTIGAGDTRAYLFTGLGQARQMGPTIQLRIKPKASPPPADDRAHLVIRLNGRFLPAKDNEVVHKVANDIAYVLDLPAEIVDEQGQLLVEMQNVIPPGMPDAENPQGTRPGSISFTPGEGMQVFYRVGSFEGNLARGMAMIWLRLGFLAMLGIVAGTFLTFPVACLLCLLVYFTSAGSAYLTESLESYGGSVQQGATILDMIAWPFTETFKHLGEGKIWDAIKVWIKLVGTGFMALVPSLGEYNPVESLTDGRVITWRWLGRAAGNVGLLWTAAIGVVGYLIFRKRELARVTV